MQASRFRTGCTICALFILAGCGSGGQPQASEANTTVTTGSVIRERTPTATEVTPAPPPPMQQSAIQTQPGPKGSQVTLNKANVTGDILTVQVTYTGGSDWQSPNLKDVSIIDDATAQRISVLKDGESNYLASRSTGV